MHSFILYEHQSSPALDLPMNRWQAWQNFLEKTWQNRLWLVEDTQNHHSHQALLKLRPPYLQARNYVGYLRYDDLELHILPKIFDSPEPPDLRLIFQHLCYYLSYGFGWRMPHEIQTMDSIPVEAWSDLWIWLWLIFTENYLIEAARWQFEIRQEQSTYFKGQLKTKAYFQKNLGNGQWQRFPIQQDKLVYDHAFHRLLKYVHHRLRASNTSELLASRLRSVDFLLKEVNEQKFDINTARKIQLSRPSPEEAFILGFAKLFLVNEATHLSGEGYQGFSLLLPMERIYERFVSGFIRRHFPAWQAQEQSSDFLAQTKIEGRPVFQIRNDIYLPQHKQILDTKYQLRPYPFENEKTGISSEDMYQMLSYGLARNSEKVVLLYPAHFQEKNWEKKTTEFVVEGGLLGDRQIQVKAMDLPITRPNLVDNIDMMETKLKIQLQAILD